MINNRGDEDCLAAWPLALIGNLAEADFSRCFSSEYSRIWVKYGELSAPVEQRRRLNIPPTAEKISQVWNIITGRDKEMRRDCVTPSCSGAQPLKRFKALPKGKKHNYPAFNTTPSSVLFSYIIEMLLQFCYGRS